nr:hypothetical protein [Desulfobulbaceae bacterium]
MNHLPLVLKHEAGMFQERNRQLTAISGNLVFEILSRRGTNKKELQKTKGNK